MTIATTIAPANKDDDSDLALGCIQTHCDLVKEAVRVSDLVRRQTIDHYGVCPKIQVVKCLPDDDGSLDGGGGGAEEERHDFTYVPHHLHYMLGELIKNSCRATVQRGLEEELQNSGTPVTCETLPPIRVVIVRVRKMSPLKLPTRVEVFHVRAWPRFGNLPIPPAIKRNHKRNLVPMPFRGLVFVALDCPWRAFMHVTLAVN